jgi:hypothetical protein
MKKLFSLFVGISFVMQAFSAALSINNGGFESGGTPGCTVTVNNATSWQAVRTVYDCHNCTNPARYQSGNALAYWQDNSNSCGSTAHSGNRYAQSQWTGFGSCNGNADNTLIYQLMSNNASANTCYRATAYVKSIQGFAVNASYFRIGFSSASTFNLIMDDIMSQANAGTLPVATFTSVGNGWYKMTADWTPSSTTTYNIVIGNTYGGTCDDGNYQTNKWIIDDVSITCLADAGVDKANNTNVASCCTCTSPSSVQIGTSHSCSDLSYSWTPTGTLSCNTCQQPNASPCTTTDYTLVVSGSYCTTASDIVRVTPNSCVTCGQNCCGGSPAPRLSGSSAAIQGEFDISIYPNPNSGLFTVTAGDGIGTLLLIKITDMQGKTVFEKSNAPKTVSVDLSKYPNGNYSIAVTDGENHVVKNIIKE